jgi:hypothetical protein
VRLAISAFAIPLDQGESVTLDATFGAFLQPTVHYVNIAPCYHAEIRLVEE